MTQKNTMILLTEKRSHTGSGKTFSDQKATVQRHQKTLFFAQIEWFYSALQKLIQNLMQTWLNLSMIEFRQILGDCDF